MCVWEGVRVSGGREWIDERRSLEGAEGIMYVVRLFTNWPTHPFGCLVRVPNGRRIHLRLPYQVVLVACNNLSSCNDFLWIQKNSIFFLF